MIVSVQGGSKAGAARVRHAFARVLSRLPEADRDAIEAIDVIVGDWPSWIAENFARDPAVLGFHFPPEHAAHWPVIALAPEWSDLSFALLTWLCAHELAHAVLHARGEDASDEDAAVKLAGSWGWPDSAEWREAWNAAWFELERKRGEADEAPPLDRPRATTTCP